MNSAHLTHPKYRPDIDGLRAIAILSVVGFHAFPYWVKGGFIGVDIFFVISGYLISTIIFGSLSRDAFSFKEFYIRRIKRIFPALLLVLITSFALGWFVLLPDEYKQLGKHIAGAAGFVSNFILWNESGYFDSEAATKPLLHLWSLGIEEQFYIFFPLLLWGAWKARLNLLGITLLIATLSFSYNIYTRSDTVADFYSPQTRFWELMVGALLAHIQLYKNRSLANVSQRLYTWNGRITHSNSLPPNSDVLNNLKSIVGTGLITLAVVFINEKFRFPGWWAVLPTFGAALIISAGKDAILNRFILSNRLMVWIGLISYPLYLWHWVLLSFAHIEYFGSPSLEIRISAVAASFLLAWLTYKLVERPMQSRKHLSAKSIALLLLMFTVGFVGYLIHSSNYSFFKDIGQHKKAGEFLSYFENSLPQRQYFNKIGVAGGWHNECAYFDINKYREGGGSGGVTNSLPRDHIDKTCFFRDTNYPKAVMIWGDSHAQALAPGIRNNIPANWQVLQVASSSCSPSILEEAPSTISQCKQSNYFALKTIKDVIPDVVVLAQIGGHNLKDMKDIGDKLISLGVKRILYIGPTPQWKAYLPKIIARKFLLKEVNRINYGLNLDVIKKNAEIKSGFVSDNARSYVDVINLFCNNDGCITYIGDDRRSGMTTWDYGHLTPIASDYLAKNILIEKIIKN